MMNGSKNLDKQWVCVPSQSVRVAARRGVPLSREILSSFCGHDELPPFVGVAELLQNV